MGSFMNPVVWLQFITRIFYTRLLYDGNTLTNKLSSLHFIVDGVWEEWSTWTTCNVTCGGGTTLRDRKCKGPYFDGLPCEGPADERTSCNTHECPGNYSNGVNGWFYTGSSHFVLLT